MSTVNPELYAVIERHFGDLGDAVVWQMYQIAMRESGGNPAVHNLNPSTRDDSWGLFQINVRPDANPQYASRDLTNPDVNAATAREMYDQSGLAPWKTTAMVSDNGAPPPPPGSGISSGGTTAAPIIHWDKDGHAYQWDPDRSGWDRAPIWDDPAKANTYTSPYDQGQLAISQGNLDARNTELAQTAAYQQADLQYKYAAAAQAKYEWEQEQALRVQDLQFKQQELAATEAQNARTYAIEQQKLQISRDQFAFSSAMDLRKETRDTQSAIFDQQAKIASLQTEQVSITQQTRETNAKLQNEVAIFNAGKAADVSMFNIDQKTKVATFNAEASMRTAQFNAQMGFDVQKANVENERLRRQQLIDVAGKIAEAAKDPGDRGALAAYALALGGGANIGATDAGLVNADLRTNDSLMPLESELRQRRDIMNSPEHPFTFTPLTAPVVATPEPAVFTPAVAAQAPLPDFSKVQMPTQNISPFDPNSIPKSAPPPATSFDSTKQNFIASGQTNTPNNQQFVSDTGQPLTAEQRAQIPDFAMQSMIDSGLIPAK